MSYISITCNTNRYIRNYCANSFRLKHFHFHHSRHKQQFFFHSPRYTTVSSTNTTNLTKKSENNTIIQHTIDGPFWSDATLLNLQNTFHQISNQQKRRVAFSEIEKIVERVSNEQHKSPSQYHTSTIDYLESAGNRYINRNEPFMSLIFFEKAIEMQKTIESLESREKLIKFHRIQRDTALILKNYELMVESSDQICILLTKTWDEYHQRNKKKKTQSKKYKFQLLPEYCDELEKLAQICLKTGLLEKALYSIDIAVDSSAVVNLKKGDKESSNLRAKFGMYHKTKANVLEAMGEQSKAIDAYRFADQTYLKNNPQAKEERATVLTQLANAELNNNNIIEAKAAANTALQTLQRTFPHRDHRLFIPLYRLLHKISFENKALTLAVRFKKLELQTVNAILMRTYGDVSAHPRLIALQDEIKSLNKAFKKHRNQRQYRFLQRRKKKQGKGINVAAADKDAEEGTSEVQFLDHDDNEDDDDDDVNDNDIDHRDDEQN